MFDGHGAARHHRRGDRSQIPSGQYQAVLIDEGHDFAPEWLKLVAQMVDPSTNSLLLLYDDAQSIYQRAEPSSSASRASASRPRGARRS
jgi:superfamily I DNA and RNA helicase